MKSAATWLGRLLAREPVLLGAALMAWVATLHLDELTVGAAGATVALVVRWLSTPTQKVAEKVELAASAAADKREVEVHADLGLLALEPPKPRKTTAKKAP